MSGPTMVFHFQSLTAFTFAFTFKTVLVIVLILDIY